MAKSEPSSAGSDQYPITTRASNPKPGHRALKAWRAAVKEIIERAGIVQARIAEAVYELTGPFSRYLNDGSGGRAPSLEKIRAINLAIGKELYPGGAVRSAGTFTLDDGRHLHVAVYLDSVLYAAQPDLKPITHKNAVRELTFGVLELRIRSDQRKAMTDGLESLTESAAREIEAASIKAFHREMLWMFDGKRPGARHERARDSMIILLEKHGLPVKTWLADDAGARYALARDHFRTVVRDVLVLATDDRLARVRFEAQIMSALHYVTEKHEGYVLAGGSDNYGFGTIEEQFARNDQLDQGQRPRRRREAKA